MVSSLGYPLCAESPPPCMPCWVSHWDGGSLISASLESSALSRSFPAAQGPRELSIQSQPVASSLEWFHLLLFEGCTCPQLGPVVSIGPPTVSPGSDCLILP